MMAISGALFAVMAIAGRACIGLVFLLAAVQKLRHWRLLPGVIANYRLLPPWAVGITATASIRVQLSGKLPSRESFTARVAAGSGGERASRMALARGKREADLRCTAAMGMTSRGAR